MNRLETNAMQAPSIVDSAEALVRVSEEVLLGRPKPSSLLAGKSGRAVWSTLGGPMSLIMQGGSQEFRGRGWIFWLLLPLAFLLFNAYLPRFVGPAGMNQLNVVLASFAALAVLMPSANNIGFGAFGADELRVAYARLSWLAALPAEAIEPHRVVLGRAEERARQRVTALKWIAGAGWALVIYFGQRGIEAKDGQLLGWAMVPLLLTGLFLVAVSFYGRGINAVFGMSEALLAQRAFDLTASRSAYAEPAASPLAALDL